VSCGPKHPFGMSEAEWNALTPKQKYNARVDQAKMIELRRSAREEERRQDAAEAEAERERISLVRAAGTYGSVADCSLQGGMANFRSGFRPMHPAEFSIVVGETQTVTLDRTEKGQQLDIEVSFTPEGDAIRFCRMFLSRTTNDCGLAFRREGRYGYQIRTSMTVARLFKEVDLFCRFPWRGG